MFLSAVPGYVPAKLVGKLRPYEEIQLTEIRQPAGREIYTIGLVRAAQGDLAVLAPGPRGVTVLSTDRRDQILARRVQNVAAARALMRVFGVLGLILTAGFAGLLYLLVA
jgi:hypothetical protein